MENKRANAEKNAAIAAAAGPKKVYKNEELATEDDIRKVFHSYAKSLSDIASKSSAGEFLNPMQFATVYRLVSGQKGNLYKEMQMFQK